MKNPFDPLNRNSDNPYCRFSLALTHEECDSLRWVLEVCEKLGQNPKSCNRQKAALAGTVIEKMRDFLADMHTTAHDLEVEVTQQAHELASQGLVVQLAKRSSTEGLN